MAMRFVNYRVGAPVEENDKILNKILINNGGSWNFEVISNISDKATFLPNLNRMIIFLIIKLSIRCV